MKAITHLQKVEAKLNEMKKANRPEDQENIKFYQERVDRMRDQQREYNIEMDRRAGWKQPSGN